jgi:hypothetical protein
LHNFIIWSGWLIDREYTKRLEFRKKVLSSSRICYYSFMLSSLIVLLLTGLTTIYLFKGL